MTKALKLVAFFLILQADRLLTAAPSAFAGEH
jgi:hypothetical protein